MEKEEEEEIFSIDIFERILTERGTSVSNQWPIELKKWLGAEPGDMACIKGKKGKYGKDSFFR